MSDVTRREALTVLAGFPILAAVPEWLRAPVLLCATVSGAYGPPLCRCDLSTLTTNRAPGDVGFILISAIGASPYFCIARAS